MGRNSKRILTVVIITMVMVLSGCEKEQESDDPFEILSRAYQNMSEADTFSARSTLDGELQYLKKTNNIKVVAEMAKTEEPYELVVKTTVDTDEEPSITSYLYGFEQQDQFFLYSYDEDTLQQLDIDSDRVEEIKDQYLLPIPFGTYLINTDSFTLAGEEDNTVMLEGTVLKEKMVTALKESGLLKQIFLTNFPEEELPDNLTIKVKVWVDRENNTIIKLEADMRDVAEAITTLLFGEDSVACPEITRCIFTIDNIVLGNADAVSLPEKAADSLDAVK